MNQKAVARQEPCMPLECVNFAWKFSISGNIRLRAIDIGQEWQKRNQKAFTEDILCKFIGAGR